MKEVHLNSQEASIDNIYSSMQLRDIHSLAVDIVLESVILLIKICMLFTGLLESISRPT